MGVTLLHSYTRIVGALQKVSLVEEIQQYRSKSQTEPLIVIDGINLLYSILRSQKISWLTNGNLLLFEKCFNSFIQNLKKELVKIVVIFDGVNWMYNRETWVERRKEGIAEFYKIFDDLDQYLTVEEIEDRHESKLPSGFFDIARKVFIENGCQIINAVYDCDFEISTYVNDHQCLGLIANDTDFLINCSCNIYTTYDLDINTLCTLKRDRKKLLISLSIDEKLLPLFASLVGNDVVSSAEVSHIRSQYIYANTKKTDVRRFFLRVSTYIRDLNISDGISDAMLEKIAFDIFNNPQKAELLRKSIESYNVFSVKYKDILKERLFSYGNKNWEIILERFFKIFRSGGDALIFGIISQGTFQCQEQADDYRKTDLPAINRILRPLRRKLYGILLHEKPGEHFVQEMVVDNPHTIEPVSVKALPPKVFHPGLLILWQKIEEDYNWSLLGDVVRVETSKIRILPSHLIVPTMAIRYLRDCAILEKWELRCLVLSALIVSYMQEPCLSSISLRRIKSRAVTIYCLFNKGCALISIVIEALGNIVPFHKRVATHYADGNVFHLIYNAMKEGIKAFEIVNIGFKKFFESKFTEFQATLEQLMNFVFED